MKRIYKIFVIAIAILFLLSPTCFCSESVDLNTQIKQEEGSLFEKIIAECIRRYSTNNFEFYHF